MKRVFLLLSAIGLLLGSLQNCKPDPQITFTDADSLYVGTKYIIKKPFRFPEIDSFFRDSLTYEGIELGRRLFYDKHLSSTGQLSCGSCHKQEFAFSDGGKAFSTNVNGLTKRNTPAIQNLIWTEKLFWDGKVDNLADQAKDAFHVEQSMTPAVAISYLETDSVYVRLFKKAFGRPGTITEDRIYLALQQFMATLISSESRFDSIQRGQGAFTDSEAEGFQLFADNYGGDCLHCHASLTNNLLMTDNVFRNNGLDSAVSEFDFADLGRGGITGISSENGLFRDPTIRNAAITGPYMHDGRFGTLEEVIEFYSTGKKMSPTIDLFMLKPVHDNGGLHLTPEEKQAILAFLNTLTDNVFITNPAFSDPFQ